MNNIKCIIFSIVFMLPVWGGEQDCVVSYPKNPVIVFDFTGSFHGWGDIIGVLWSMLGMQKHYPNGKYYALVDARAKEILEKNFNTKNLQQALHVEQVVSQTEVSLIPQANFVFQLFVGGRKIDSFEAPYVTPKTVMILADTMHGSTLSEVRFGNSHIFFKPPGIGDKRSGIVEDPSAGLFAGKDKQKVRQLVANFFMSPSDKNLHRLLSGALLPKAKFGFFYGAHNEQFSVKGQTLAYVQAISQSSRGSKAPIFLFTPNSEADLNKIGIVNNAPNYTLLNLQGFRAQTNFTSGVYVVSLGSITGEQFAGLISVSNFPALLEGNNAISSALRMHRPFLVYRSGWNKPFIEDIVSYEKQYFKTTYFEDIYAGNLKNDQVVPNFLASSLLTGMGDKKEKSAMYEFYSKFSDHIADLNVSLVTMMRVAQKLQKLNCMKTNIRNERAILKIADRIEDKLKDPYVAYSIALNAYTQKKLSLELFKEELHRITQEGYDPAQMEQRFKVIPGGFGTETIKFQLLTRAGLLDNDQLPADSNSSL